MPDPWRIEGIMLWQSNLVVGSAINAIHMFNSWWSRFSVLSSFKYCPNVKYHSLQETWWDHEWNNRSCCGTIIGVRNNDMVGKGVSFFFKRFPWETPKISNATKNIKRTATGKTCLLKKTKTIEGKDELDIMSKQTKKSVGWEYGVEREEREGQYEYTWPSPLICDRFIWLTSAYKRLSYATSSGV